MKKPWFEYASPESVGISSDAVQRLIDVMCMTEMDEEIHGFTIIRHNKIVAEGDFAPFDGRPHVIHSCSKAFTATAIGFAQDEGLLSVDDPIIKYLEEYAPPKDQRPPELERLTIRHLLTMSSGHSVSLSQDLYDGMLPLPAKRKFMACSFDCEPGTNYRYDNANSYMMSEIITRLTGLDPMDYLRPRLLDKLGIADIFYERDADGMFVGHGSMRLTREELARLGRFYLNGGVWEGERLLSEEWVKEATSFHTPTGTYTSTPGVYNTDVEPTDWNHGYAFHLWRGQRNSFRFCGAYRQFCACYPDHDLIFCLNSGHDETVQAIFNSFYRNIVDVIEDRLPENPAALAALRRRCEDLSLPAQYSLPSSIIPSINGKEWEICDCGEIIKAKLDFTDTACRISLAFKNGDGISFDAGLKETAFTDCPDTHIVTLQPKDEAVCAATGCWSTLNEFAVTARMLPTHTKFKLKFTFNGADGNIGCRLDVTYRRAYEFGTRPLKA